MRPSPVWTSPPSRTTTMWLPCSRTALRATSSTDLDNVEVYYDSAASAFVVTIPLASNGAATSVSAAFTGSESDELGLDTATIVDGVSAIQSGSVTLLGETFSGLDFSSRHGLRRSGLCAPECSPRCTCDGPGFRGGGLSRRGVRRDNPLGQPGSGHQRQRGVHWGHRRRVGPGHGNHSGRRKRHPVRERNAPG